MSGVRMTFNCCLQWPYYFIKSNYPVERSASASSQRNGEGTGLPCGRHSTAADGSFDWAANRGRKEPAIIWLRGNFLSPNRTFHPLSPASNKPKIKANHSGLPESAVSAGRPLASPPQLPRTALGSIGSTGKLHHTRRHLYPSVTPSSSPRMTTLPAANVQMLIVLTERNGLVASIN